MQVLLVADTTEDRTVDNDTDTDFEIWSKHTIEEIIQALESAGHQAFHVTSPTDIRSRFGQIGAANTVVLSIWSGKANRNRRSFAPAICEALNLPYIGPDPYAVLVTADKKLSKVICADFDLNTPKDIVVRREADTRLLAQMTAPLVVKPLFEGGSIGINQSSLVRTIDAAREKALWSLNTFNQPAIVEEFIGGREVNFCLIQDRDRVLVRCVEICVEEPDFFDEHLYGHDIKRSPIHKAARTFIDITDSIDPDLISRLSQLFTGLGKVDFIRIDGKLDDDGRFTCIELSCDPDIGTKGSFYAAYHGVCGGFPGFLDQLISSRKS